MEWKLHGPFKGTITRTFLILLSLPVFSYPTVFFHSVLFFISSRSPHSFPPLSSPRSYHFLSFTLLLSLLTPPRSSRPRPGGLSVC